MRIPYTSTGTSFKALLLGIFLYAAEAHGSLINLTTSEVAGVAATTSATVGDAIFQADVLGSGSGTFTRWYAIQSNTTEEGYNYDGTGNLPFDQKSGVGERTLRLSDLTFYNVGGNLYTQFILDINENNSLLSLDSFQLYVNNNPSATPLVTNTSNLSQLGNLVYDLDAGQNRTVLIEQRGSGSGNSDMVVLVSANVFQGYAPDAKLYLYSALGGAGTMQQTSGGVPTGTNLNFTSTGGFEEWAYSKDGMPFTPVPEASTLVQGALMLCALGWGMMVQHRRRRKPTAAVSLPL